MYSPPIFAAGVCAEQGVKIFEKLIFLEVF